MKRKREEVDHPQRPSHPLLRSYYPEVVTLRQFLTSRIAKRNRRRLQQYGRDGSPADAAVTELLDTTIVGCYHRVSIESEVTIEKEISLFSQQVANSCQSAVHTPGIFKQTQIVDFVIWLLFRRQLPGQKMQHLLCQGLHKYMPTHPIKPEPVQLAGVPGVWRVHRNEQAESLRRHPWNVVPDLLGSRAERILCDLFLECGIFVPAGEGGNLIQLSGMPMYEIPLLKMPAKQPPSERTGHLTRTRKQQTITRGLSDIRFVRHRMLYARAANNDKGHVRFGLNPIHVLNRLRNTNDEEETKHLMRYLFPRQFGLHNVFTHSTDRKDTALKFKDYTLREREISEQVRKRPGGRDGQSSNTTSALPKRLRGPLVELVRRLRVRQAKCSYSALLNHYCPPSFVDQGLLEGSIAQAAKPSQVSAFCRAVITKVFPAALWGIGDEGTHNARLLSKAVDEFIRIRRYESMTLHDVLQGMKLAKVPWLVPPKLGAEDKLSRTDLAKRTDLMAELIYYLFDSFLIPLISSHFHVTESNVHRNQIFYFRQDVWKQISKPALESLKATMLEECGASAVKNMSGKRALGISHVRLLPKAQGMRPIINLRRRVQVTKKGTLVLGRSINNILTPAFSVLNCEKDRCRDLLGSALFSVDDILPRLQTFRKSLSARGHGDRPLYFAKVDVQACFDSIPQKRLLQLVKTLLAADEYHIGRYARAKLLGAEDGVTPGFGSRPSWKFLTKAVSGQESFDFLAESREAATGRKRTVFINGGMVRSENRRAVLALLQEHVESNLIKIGKKFYRQKEGIPQGSIVSSLLCSYFYAELERKVLGFVHHAGTVLLRLIDDFLIISTERGIAEQFVCVMHAGVPEFGIRVKPEKSRTNFSMSVDGTSIPRSGAHCDFPYCGNAINTHTLDISRDQERRIKNNISDSVTVEYSRLPGQSFYRKTLNALKLHMQAMLLSTHHNSLQTVLANLYDAFFDVAQKAYHYGRSLSSPKQPSDDLIIKTLDDMIKLACVLMRRRKRSHGDAFQYECSVSDRQARWLACTACFAVFQRRQTKHRRLLDWLGGQQRLLIPRTEQMLLQDVARTRAGG